MSLIQYNPWPLFDALRRDLDSTVVSAHADREWQPRADIVEFKDRYEIRMDLPGVAADAVDIDLHDGTLTVQGHRNVVRNEDEQPQRERRERIEGRFQRQFSLPRTISLNDVSATSENGVLLIELPKAAEAQPIKVKVAA